MQKCSYEKALQTLMDEREIYQAILRYCRALDRRDEELLLSVYHPDAYDDHGPFFQGNAQKFAKYVMQRLSEVDTTTHMVANVLIEVEGNVAYAESYLLANHRIGGAAAAGGKDRAPAERAVSSEGDDTRCFTFNPPGTDFFGAGRYVDRFERRNSTWRIAHRRMVMDWTRIDHIYMELPSFRAFELGRRSREDPAYQRVRSPDRSHPATEGADGPCPSAL